MIEEPDFKREFVRDGAPPNAGTQWVYEDQATTLEDIAATKGESFYRGRLAEKWWRIHMRWAAYIPWQILRTIVPIGWSLSQWATAMFVYMRFRRMGKDWRHFYA
jgi:hypothetical protein